MTPELEAKLTRLQNRATRYEVTATHMSYPSILIGYTPLKSRSGLLVVLAPLADDILNLTGCDQIRLERKCLVNSTGWTFRFSGRTQRDAYVNGERPFIKAIQSLEDLYGRTRRPNGY